MSEKNKIKILAFGYIPKQLGGKQTSGLATGTFELFDYINKCDKNIEISIAATDIYKNTYISNTHVYGWKKYLSFTCFNKF